MEVNIIGAGYTGLLLTDKFLSFNFKVNLYDKYENICTGDTSKFAKILDRDFKFLKNNKNYNLFLNNYSFCIEPWAKKTITCLDKNLLTEFTEFFNIHGDTKIDNITYLITEPTFNPELLALRLLKKFETNKNFIFHDHDVTGIDDRIWIDCTNIKENNTMKVYFVETEPYPKKYDSYTILYKDNNWMNFIHNTYYYPHTYVLYGSESNQDNFIDLAKYVFPFLQKKLVIKNVIDINNDNKKIRKNYNFYKINCHNPLDIFDIINELLEMLGEAHEL